jgi:hypothetical protein
MPSAYENIRKLNSLLHGREPLTEQKRNELARLRTLVQAQLVQAEGFARVSRDLHGDQEAAPKHGAIALPDALKH